MGALISPVIEAYDNDIHYQANCNYIKSSMMSSRSELICLSVRNFQCIIQKISSHLIFLTHFFSRDNDIKCKIRLVKVILIIFQSIHMRQQIPLSFVMNQ